MCRLLKQLTSWKRLEKGKIIYWIITKLFISICVCVCVCMFVNVRICIFTHSCQISWEWSWYHGNGQMNSKEFNGQI